MLLFTVIQWFLAVSITNPQWHFLICLSPPTTNQVQLSNWSHPQCTWGNYQKVIVTLAYHR